MEEDDFSSGDSMGIDQLNMSSLCGNDTEDSQLNQHYLHEMAWWFEYFLQTVIGVAGLLANTLAIPILCSREMNSIFNRLLIFLAVFDNLYIICSVLEGKRKLNESFDQVHEYAFGYALYPMHNFVLCCSIYTTVALALERYRAVWRPVEYHNRCKGINPWKRVFFSYALPVVIFSFLFNIPKFFEVTFVTKSDVIHNSSLDLYNNSNPMIVQVSIDRLVAAPTELRLNAIYVIIYVNILRLFVQGIIPFICLSFLNYRIYWVIKRRRHLMNRQLPKKTDMRLGVHSVENGGQLSRKVEAESRSAAQRKANEAQQAAVLFFIVLLFFICHTPRFILNVHELFTLEELRKSIENECNTYSVFAMSAASVSHCLMTLNSSVNFFIYCFMCSTFRQVMFRWLRPIYTFICRQELSSPGSPVFDPPSAVADTLDNNVITVTTIPKSAALLANSNEVIAAAVHQDPDQQIVQLEIRANTSDVKLHCIPVSPEHTRPINLLETSL